MSEDEARAAFRAVRFAENGGEPFCPHCGCDAVYEYQSRRIFKCKACERQFSLTSGTLFASRKFTFGDILFAIALFVDGANGVAALNLGRRLECSYKSAFVLAHKLRQAMRETQVGTPLTGEVEIDGARFGGHVRPKNFAEKRIDRRLKENRSEKAQTVVVVRERAGRSRSIVCREEGEAVPFIMENVDPSATIYADEAKAWNDLHTHARVRRINHKKAYALGEIHTNNVESAHSRLRRAEIGVHHRVAGRYILNYSSEMLWRDEHNRISNGTQFDIVLAAAARAPATTCWKGYWRKRKSVLVR